LLQSYSSAYAVFDIAMDASDHLWVSHYGTKLAKIGTVDSGGVIPTLVPAFTIPGYNSSVGVDSAGNVYTGNTDDMEVRKYDTNGAFIGAFGSSGIGPGQFSGGTSGSPNLRIAPDVGPDGIMWVGDSTPRMQ
jgi:hypothetical protein